MNFTKLRAIIIDDEKRSISNLNYNLTAYFSEQIEVIATETNPLIGVEKINQLQPDILFLDIRMPNLDGFQLLEQINTFEFILIFTTAHSEYGVRAIKASAFDYLMKPLDPLELKSTVDKILKLKSLQLESGLSQMDTKEALTLLGRNLSKEEYPKQLMIPYQDGYKTIDVKQLLYLKAEVNYTTLFIEGLGPLLITKTLKSFEELLDKEQFIRIHKSYIINLAYVKEVKKSEKHFIFMKNEEELPIARRRLSYVLDKILLK